MDPRALSIATAVGTVGQVAMVLAGHLHTSVANLFGVLGVTISLVAGLLYGVLARKSGVGGATAGGLLAGGICAFIGIAISYALGDVTAAIFALGTLSSAVTGAIGGAIGWLISGRGLRNA